MKKIRECVNEYSFLSVVISIIALIACLCILLWSFVVECLKFCDRRPESIGVVITVIISCIAGLFSFREYLYLKKRGKLRIQHLYDSIKNCFDVYILDIAIRCNIVPNTQNIPDFQSMNFEHRKIFANNKKMAISKIAEEIEELENLIYENGAKDNSEYFTEALTIIDIMRNTFVSINNVYDLLCKDTLIDIDTHAIKKVVEKYNAPNKDKDILEKYNKEKIKKYFRLSYKLF